ncbi:hypothetical protein DE149_101208 [Micrococcus sp. KT16]|nr:hypothetical protein DE149_101208 [Micrococcus sp. KT16]
MSDDGAAAARLGSMPELLILIVVLAVAVVAARWALRTFRPEIDRARRIRRANRGGELER